MPFSPSHDSQSVRRRLPRQSNVAVSRFQRACVLLASAEILLIGLAVVAGTISERFLPAAFMAAASWWLVRWAAYGRPSVRTPLDLSVGLLLLMIPVTLWVTIAPEITRSQVFRLLLGVALFYAVANWTDSPRRLRLLVMGTLTAGLLLAFSAPLTVEWVGGKFSYVPAQLYAPFTPLAVDLVNPNVMAGALVIVLPVALALPLYAWNELAVAERGLAVLSALAMSVVMVLMQSRGALIAGGAAVVVLALMRWSKGRWVWGAGISGAVALALVQAIRGGPSSTVASAGESFESRLELWSRGLYIIEDFPFTGVGMGAFQEVTNALYPILSIPGGQPHAHNLFLQVAIDLGLPGLIAWLAMMMLVFCAAWRLYKTGRRQDNWFLAGLGAGLLAGQVALIVHGLTDAVTWGMVRTAVIVWGLWGLSIAGWKLQWGTPGRSRSLRGQEISIP